jgi:two-component system response regulator HydG
MKSKIFVVDDEVSLRRMLVTILTAEGYIVEQAADGKIAVDAVEKGFYDLILMDIRMQEMGGIQALNRIREISPGIPVIIMTAYASVDTAVEAMKSGAFDYITKPLDNEELIILVKRALRHNQLEKENLYLKEQLKERYDFSHIIGNSRVMREMFKTLTYVAPTDATVLIAGESGTGKELVADAIHQNSPRKERPMIKVNCAALPENLLESELFGHERGAFTGANHKRQGRFQAANQSSLFLDEIGEMTPTTQAKILRALQEGEIEPLGGGLTVKVDVRVIAATNKNLEEEILKKRFREDLYYRLNVVKIEVPPLKDRKEDLPLLADFFLKRYVKKNRKLIKGFTPHALDIMMRYFWPGNVRELENLVERSVIMARGDMITPEEFPDTMVKNLPDEAVDHIKLGPGRSLKEVEKEMILRTLEETGGNRTRAAKILGISRRTLQLKLKDYGIN